MWTMGLVPDAMARLCSVVAKPVAEIVSSYTPMGACSRSNSPSESVLALRVKADSAALSVTLAPGMGRCCGSWTTPWTLAKTVASAGMEAARKSNAERIEERRRIRNGPPDVNAICLSHRQFAECADGQKPPTMREARTQRDVLMGTLKRSEREDACLSKTWSTEVLLHELTNTNRA